MTRPYAELRKPAPVCVATRRSSDTVKTTLPFELRRWPKPRVRLNLNEKGKTRNGLMQLSRARPQQPVKKQQFLKSW